MLARLQKQNTTVQCHRTNVRTLCVTHNARISFGGGLTRSLLRTEDRAEDVDEDSESKHFFQTIVVGVIVIANAADASHGGHSTTHRKQDVGSGYRKEPLKPTTQDQFAKGRNYRFQDHGNYNFGYHITDGYGAKNGREEHGDGYGNKKGSYYLQDVDGRWRKVGRGIVVLQDGLASRVYESPSS